VLVQVFLLVFYYRYRQVALFKLVERHHGLAVRTAVTGIAPNNVVHKKVVEILGFFHGCKQGLQDDFLEDCRVVGLDCPLLPFLLVKEPPQQIIKRRFEFFMK
jgi:hypothetical protein